MINLSVYKRMLKNSTISDCSLIKLPKIKNRSGNITAIENNTHIAMGSTLFEDLYDNFSYINNRLLKNRKKFIK